jgi:hypothetical protein
VAESCSENSCASGFSCLDREKDESTECNNIQERFHRNNFFKRLVVAIFRYYVIVWMLFWYEPTLSNECKNNYRMEQKQAYVNQVNANNIENHHFLGIFKVVQLPKLHVDIQSSSIKTVTIRVNKPSSSCGSISSASSICLSKFNLDNSSAYHNYNYSEEPNRQHTFSNFRVEI